MFFNDDKANFQKGKTLFNKDNFYAYVVRETLAQTNEYEGSLFNLRIHIVQKGDTLFDVAKKYHVDFEDIVRLNPQLSSPDMIMPGMKIKIPSESKQVRNEMGGHTNKEVRTSKDAEGKMERKDVKAQTAERPMGNTVIHDDKEKRTVKPEMPKNTTTTYPTSQPPRMPSKLETENVLSETKKGTEYMSSPYMEQKQERVEHQAKPSLSAKDCPEPMYGINPEMGMVQSMCTPVQMSTRPMEMGPSMQHQMPIRPIRQEPSMQNQMHMPLTSPIGMEQPMFHQMQVPMNSQQMYHCCCCCHRDPMFGQRQPFYQPGNPYQVNNHSVMP